MQSLKKTYVLRRFLQKSRFCSVSSSSAALIDEPETTVLVEGKASSRTAILDRPNALNALNHATRKRNALIERIKVRVHQLANVLKLEDQTCPNAKDLKRKGAGNEKQITLFHCAKFSSFLNLPVARLMKLYKNWEDDPDIGFVVLKGSGRAFSAGGDIVTVYNLLKQGNVQECKDFFRTIYSFIYVIGTYLKPHVALLNGITMGGGAGISIPGTFRIATEKTVFATPETLIGFHPDAGASFYLSHLPGYLGEYLALTGDKLSGVEMTSCGLATHFSHSTKLPITEEQLGKLMTDDPSVIETSLENCAEVVHPDPTSALRRIETIDKCFSHDTVEEIIDALECEASQKQDAWCISTLNRLKETSPLSLKVSLKSIREGRHQTLDQCLSREYRMSVQAFSGQITGDFREGVRARLVDRDHAPKWDPPSLEKVTGDMVDQYFSRLTAFEPELELPTQQREAFT